MKKEIMRIAIASAFLLAWLLPQHSPAANAQILGWNNLGMHCMDSDYSVFSILPPYNTVEAQLIVGGKLITNSTGYSVTYRAVADPAGSINTTSAGKGNFHQFTPLLYGAVAINQGLPFPGPDSFWMPGTNNTPQAMLFDSGLNWFYAYGIPITPYDDAGHKNPYPLMRAIAYSGATPIATNDIVLPVSDEMDCRICHASGTQAAAQPAAGWVWSDNPERDFRLNILRLHDEHQFAQHHDVYVSALGARPGNGKSFNPQGLYRSVVADNQPVLCAVCHASEALATTSYSNIPPLTASVHSKHATVLDPTLGITLDNSANRAACYRCHPGSATKCLRGAMGGAIASDGSMEMQCQSCHGNMSQVGASNRTGWLMEPNCQSCHTGTATSNNGQIRYSSSFTDANWTVRVAANQTFATKSNTPAAGISLYRFSTGHGGLQCSACHGSTHAEFPATHRNDNIRNEKIQGHAGVTVECTACHTTTPNTTSGGPHGLHPVGQTWIDSHPDIVENSGASQCQACHGTDYRGTVLSRMQSNRTLSAFNTKNWWRGFQVGCYNCHNGPSSEDQNSNAPAVVSNANTNTTCGTPVSVSLNGTDANGNPLTFRVVSQPENGSVGLNNNVATYFPAPGFVGTNRFTFAAWDGSTDSNLGTGTVAVAQGPFSVTAQAHVPSSYPVNWSVPFAVIATPVNVNATPAYHWNFGDGSAANTNQYPTHAYASPGSFNWSVVSAVQSGITQVTATNTGTIVISGSVALLALTASGGDTIQFSWPLTLADVLLESSPEIGAGANWIVCTNIYVLNGGNLNVTVLNTGGQKFYRLRKL